MITPELINYIKAQLAAGTSREQVTRDLLEQSGWTQEQVQEAFKVAQSNVPVAPEHQSVRTADMTEMTKPPKSIRRFEWLMYGSVGGSVLVLVLQAAGFGYDLPTALVGSIVPLLGSLLSLVLVYLVVYKRVDWARIALAVLFGFGLLSIPTFLFLVLSDLLFLVALVPMVLEAIAIYYVFQPDSNAWLADPGSAAQARENGYSDGVAPASTAETGQVNTYWSKWIPAVNGLFLLGVMGMMFVVNVIILLTDSLGLGLETMAFFYAIMFIPTGIFVAFYFYERRTLANRYQRSHSRLDPLLLILIVVRNTAFVASVIPFVQILGMGALMFGGIPYLIVYYFILRARNQSAGVA